MSVVHNNLRADGEVPAPAPSDGVPAPSVKTLPRSDHAELPEGRLLSEASLRKKLDMMTRRTGRTASGVASEETRRRDVRHTAQLLKDGIVRLEAENRELRAKLSETQRALAEERRFSEETARQMQQPQE